MKLEDDLCTHHLNLDFSNEFLSDSEAETCIKLPYPIHKPLKDTNVDIISKFNEELDTYTNQFVTMGREFQLVKNKIMNQSFDNSHATITRGLLDFCNTEKCEAPFHCDYNPYYATGLLQHFQLNNNEYLVRPDCENNLYVTNLGNPWKSDKLDLNTQSLEQITGISTCSDCGIFLLLRHKNVTNLIKIDDLCTVLDVKWKKQFNRTLLDSKMYKSRLGVVLLGGKFRLYDVEMNKKIDAKGFNIKSPTRFEFLEENNVALLGQNCLTVIDQRSNDCKVIEPELDGCNYLCSFKIDNSQVYIGTRHHLIRTDLRFFKNLEFCTHLMKYSPCYMDFRDKFLCLASQKVEEKVLFSGSPINSLPTNIPSVFETLTECSLRKDILLRTGITERLQKSVGGVKLMRDNDDVCLYSVNTSGDIFKQKITNNSQGDESDPVDSLYQWLNKLPEAPKTLHLTNVANLSNARFALNKRIEHEHLAQFTKKSKKANLFLKQFNKTYHKNNLGELATNFVSIWDEDAEARPDDVELVPEVAPLDKVSSWIESSSNFFE